MNKKIILLLVASLFIATACARVPSTKTSHHVIEKYFHKYGKHYKKSDFGINQIESVSVIETKEIHKQLAAVTAEVKLQNGPIYMVRCMIERKTLGWYLASWERL